MNKLALLRINIATVVSLLVIVSVTFTWLNSKQLVTKRSVKPTTVATIFDVDEFLRLQAIAQKECNKCNQTSMKNASVVNEKHCLILLWYSNEDVSAGRPDIPEGTTINNGSCKFTYQKEFLFNASVVVFEDHYLPTHFPWQHYRYALHCASALHIGMEMTQEKSLNYLLFARIL